MYIGMTEAFSIGNAKDQMEINYFDAMRTIQSGLSAMGTVKSELIINTSSLVRQISSPFFATYSATKHALLYPRFTYEVSPFWH
ncbi:MAG: SDR family NAD(P)-dependent oxidoreductase [Cyanobacteria bacterium WB6_1B_304]|nr:SDR family NAD(P)-dependent oxidoreductase [Cyanobacteria bacterium WB6_1B_304]